jgi:ABC-type branched-subunit amino acid transport system substrate-binding protein
VGGGEEPPLRIGVIVDCVGVYRSLEDAELSSAALPLVERGARLRDRRAVDGLTPARVADRRVELVPGCTEVLEFSTLATELRRLVERERVDVVVAAVAGPDELVVRDVARKYPRVVFIPVAHGPREVTLHRAAPNLFRFSADYGQGVAGLATHAYRELGWRRVAIVLANWADGWSSRDAFAAEFCALGGSVRSQVAVDFFDPAGRDVAKLPRDVDGVAVFAAGFFGPAGFMRRLGRRVDEPGRRIVVGPGLTDDAALLRQTRGAIDGAVGSSNVEPLQLRAYLRSFSRAFPGIDADLAASEQVSGYRDAVEAVLRALERADADVARLPSTLARLRIDLVSGRVRLDPNRQAVVSTSLVRIAGADRREHEALRRIAGVDQSIGGLLAPSAAPSDRPWRCQAGERPPPWAG